MEKIKQREETGKDAMKWKAEGGMERENDDDDDFHGK